MQSRCARPHSAHSQTPKGSRASAVIWLRRSHLLRFPVSAGAPIGQYLPRPSARDFLFSLLDNAPHYATALDSGTYARNARLPRLAQWLVMGHNFHGIHHGATGLKWQELRAAFVHSGANYEGTWPAMVLRQFRGPVFLD